MGLIHLESAHAVKNFLSNHDVCIITFSAHWCGPCNASKPKLEQLANDSPIRIAIVHEDDIGNELHNYNIRAFPTYVCFVETTEVERVQGVNFTAIQQMITNHKHKSKKGDIRMNDSEGNALGGSGSTTPLSPEEARKLRLAKLGGSSPAAAAAPAPTSTPAPDKDEKPPAKAEEEKQTSTATTTTTPMDTSTDAAPDATAATTDTDATMTDAAAATETCTIITEEKSGLDTLDQEAIKTLTESMGFSVLRAQKGLLYSSTKEVPGTLESAVEWLMQHQEDDNIDDPIPEDDIPKSSATSTDGAAKAQSYKCNDCGKVLSNMANLELHANKTGHSDFEESTQRVKPLTAEEKAAKILEIKELLKKKRSEREEAEKEDEKEREKQRRFMGKEMAKTREQMEAEQRKREAKMRRKEKEDFKRERQRIRAELEKDKRERQANKGKLSSKLGVEGYNPDAIQYDQDADGGGGDGSGEQQTTTTMKSKKSGGGGGSTASVAKIDEYISKVSSYRAGGDGGKALKILKAYVGNVADNPTETKFQTINMENKAYKTKIKPFLGAKSLLLAVGFAPKDGEPTFLQLKNDADITILKETKTKLEAAMKAFG